MLNNPAVRGDIEKIINGPVPDVFNELSVVIVANSVRLKIPNVLSRTVLRDYERNYGDEHYITIQVGRTTYADYIYPYRDNLKFELIRNAVSTKGDDIGPSERLAVLYQGFMLNPVNVAMVKRNRDGADKSLDELAGFIELDFQLIEPELNAMRMVYVSGPYRDTTVEEVITGLMHYNIKEAIPDSEISIASRRVKTPNVARAHNTKVYSVINVKTGTPLKDLPLRLQEDKGVYTGGIGRFYQDGFWHVYPLYDYTRFKSTTARLTIYNVPPDELIEPERSFQVNGQDIHVLATGDTQILDNSEKVAQDVGTSVRFIKAGSLVDDMVNISKNKATPTYDDTNHHIAVQKKPTQLTNSRYAKNVLTDNPFVDLSMVSRGLGFTVICKWVNAKPKYVYPGMPVRFYYEDNDELKEAWGTLLGVKIEERSNTKSLNDNLYQTNCVLVLHVQNL